MVCLFNNALGFSLIIWLILRSEYGGHHSIIRLPEVRADLVPCKTYLSHEIEKL